MSLTNDVIAALALALVFPAVLFVAALFLRQLRPPDAELRYFSWRVLTAIPAHLPAELVDAATVVSGYVLAMMVRQLRHA